MITVTNHIGEKLFGTVKSNNITFVQQVNTSASAKLVTELQKTISQKTINWKNKKTAYIDRVKQLQKHINEKTDKNGYIGFRSAINCIKAFDEVQPTEQTQAQTA